MTGAAIGKIKDTKFSTIIGLFLLIWFFINFTQKILVMLEIREFQFDLQNFYIMIDVMTICYFLHVKISRKINSSIFKIILIFLLAWYTTFTFVDVFIVPVDQPISLFSQIIFIIIGMLTMFVIAFHEIESNKIKIGNLLKW